MKTSSGRGMSIVGRVIIGVLAVGYAFVLLRGLIDNPVLFLQQIINGFQLGFVYALIALGYTMVYGIVKLINFAHGDIFMIGAFVSYFAISYFGVTSLKVLEVFGDTFGPIVGTGIVVLMAMAICALMAVTIERVAYKPLRNAPRISALITAIAVSFFLEYFAALDFVFTSNFIIYERPFDLVVWSPIPGVTISNIMLIIAVVSILFLLLLQYIVHRTKMGKAMRACSYDKPTSRLMGIDVDKVISFTFALGAALAGAGGVLYAIAYPQLIVFMGIMPGLKAFVAAVLGGIGSIPGAFVGSLIMGQAEVLSAGYISTTMRDAIAFTILILVLVVKPTGLFGEPEGQKV
jgi:branched-chain amino acid transport system permease protein